MAVEVVAVDDGNGGEVEVTCEVEGDGVRGSGVVMAARMGCEGVVTRVEVMDDNDDDGSIVGVWRLWKAACGRKMAGIFGRSRGRLPGG
ncbi:hypothetical protein Tco_0492684 [Tanacetum coccineum]